MDLPIDIPITDELLPLILLEDCPYYIKDNAKQMVQCYESGLYDAALVMMRKLIETLIIECFEKHNIEDLIQDKNDHFLYLSDLIPIFSSCKNGMRVEI